MSNQNKVRVMVVDDSAVIRGFLTRYLESDPEIDVVSSAINGEVALQNLKRHDLDVIVLDIEMPVMDGMTALPLLLKEDKNIQIIMASTLTQKNAAVTLEALQIGAAECLAKPTSSQELSSASNFKRDLIEKAKALGRHSQDRKNRAKVIAQTATSSVTNNISPTPIAPIESNISLRNETYFGKIDAIAIGSSTGGPQALIKVMDGLKNMNIKQPIFITQHMPPTFTKIMADNIKKNTGLECIEAEDGQEVLDSHIYVAPGDYHMIIKNSVGKKRISLNQNPPENYCRPSVDPMFRSLTETYGNKFLAVILTGMGHDGLESSKKIAEIGGNLIAQDKETSVVWGMPGAVAEAGICSRIVALEEISKNIISYANR